MTWNNVYCKIMQVLGMFDLEKNLETVKGSNIPVIY